MGDALVDRGDSAQWVLVKDSEDMSKLRKTIKKISCLCFFLRKKNVMQAVVMFLRWYFEKKKLK